MHDALQYAHVCVSVCVFLTLHFKTHFQQMFAYVSFYQSFLSMCVCVTLSRIAQLSRCYKTVFSSYQISNKVQQRLTAVHIPHSLALALALFFSLSVSFCVSQSICSLLWHSCTLAL